jgi:demethylmenaquinone methyltransferase/2-methoxy-6-polyprenyl-1,4-benzoquinol methylase
VPTQATTETTPAPAGWTRDELSAGDPHASAQKADKVRSMFASIAGAYDLNNRLHSFGRDRAWRRKTVRLAQVSPGEHVLDVACGTGELTRAFAAMTTAERVVGLDYTKEMLDIARAKRDKIGVEYTQGDAMLLPFPDASFDVVSIAFGIRNVQEPAKAVAEFRRVLKPGGRLLILEFSRPRNALIRAGNDFYSGWLMPRTATLISGDKSGAYYYLPKSVESFISPEQLGSMARGAGFGGVLYTPMTFGVVTITRATVPA